jgi:hypothetical protein
MVHPFSVLPEPFWLAGQRESRYTPARRVQERLGREAVFGDDRGKRAWEDVDREGSQESDDGLSMASWFGLSAYKDDSVTLPY